MGSSKDPVLVILQMNGANDYMNTVVPYSNPLYHENRPTVGIRDEDLLMIDDTYGFAPWFGPLKKFWDEGKMALVHGVGFANSPRSHFRAMDIWNTCEPETTGTEGWVARSIEQLDPKGGEPGQGREPRPRPTQGPGKAGGRCDIGVRRGVVRSNERRGRGGHRAGTAPYPG